MLTTILFDLDGTLANTDPIHYQVWAELLESFSITLTPQFYNGHISGRRNRDLMVDLFPDWPVDRVDQFSDHKEALFRTRAAEKLRPLPGLLAFLDWLETQGLRYGVVTNAPRANAEFMLATLGLADRIETLVIGEEATAAKPDPAPYQLGLRNLGENDAKRAIAFEDSRTGMVSASRAGLYPVGVTTTHSAAELEQAGAKVTIPDFEVVLDLPPIREFLAQSASNGPGG